jgi:hypothetical protein
VGLLGEPAVVVKPCERDNGGALNLDKGGMDLGFDILAT